MIEQTLNNSLMEEYRDYLECRLKSFNKILRNVSYIRRLHNYVGKPYIAINKADIRRYLNYLMEVECLQYYTLSRHLAAIKDFYNYLQLKGEIIKNPCEGLRIKHY